MCAYPLYTRKGLIVNAREECNGTYMLCGYALTG
jgi:hypothetical protein